MRKEIEIRVGEEYGLGVKNEPEGRLIVYLPCDDGGRLIKILRDQGSELFEDVLGPSWGYSGPEGWRRMSVTFHGDDWDEIVEQIEEAREEVITTLKQVIRENLQKMKEKPDDKDYTVLIVVDEE